MTRYGTKGQRRRAEIVAAAAEIVVTAGPGAVSHRGVAHRAGVSLSATTYYFESLQELLGEAGALLISRWAEHAEAVVARARATGSVPEGPTSTWAPLLVAAVVPPSGVIGHYQHLLQATTGPGLTTAFRQGRGRLQAALAELLGLAGAPCPPGLVLAVVDGAVISALSEGRNPTDHARLLVAQLLALS